MNKIMICLGIFVMILLCGCNSDDECIEVLDDETKEYKIYCDDDDDDSRYHHYRSRGGPYKTVKKSSSSFVSRGPGTRGK